MRMKPLNVRKNKGTIECDKSTVTYNVCIAQYKNETVKCKKKKRKLPNVTKILSNVMLEQQNVRKNNRIPKCDKRTVTCDIKTTQCEDETIECDDLYPWYQGWQWGRVGPKDGIFVPVPHGFVLPYSCPIPHDGENFLILFFLGFRIITLYFKLRKTRVLVSILVFMKLLTLRKAYSFLNVACNLVIIRLLTLTKTYSFLHGKLKFHFKIITKISKFLAYKFIVL